MLNPMTILLLACGIFGASLATDATALAAAPSKTQPKNITMEQAEAIALEHVPGGVVEDIERDRELGKLVYEIDVRAPDGREHELVIDAADGRILSEEVSRD